MSSSENQSPRPPDPFELWRQIYETNERAWNTVLSAQKTVRDNMRLYLEQINLPTREDIARLGELIVALEEKVDQLDDRLSGIEATLRSQAPAEPPATPA